MTLRKEIGKISKTTFGFGGYQGVQFGYWLTLDFGGIRCTTGEGAWSKDRTESCKWTEEDRSKQYADIMRLLCKTMKEANVESFDKLAGIPIEATFEGNLIKSWRILTEVI